MDPELIVNWAQAHRKTFSSSEVVAKFKVSRQTSARLLKKLVSDGKLAKTGSTRGAKYSFSKRAIKPRASVLNLKKKLKGLAEDKVFDEVDLRLGMKSRCSENAFQIANYAFCEMLNNAIDHSQGSVAEIQATVINGKFDFTIRDRGIGIFKNIANRFRLTSDEEAIEHLLKGKQTTAPEAHSGQGIFFTSKIADVFFIRSGKFQLGFDNERNDIHLKEQRLIVGTEVRFSIKLQTRRKLKSLFEQFANEDFEFDRTQYPVVILTKNGAISRSQARRLTVGLEKFDRVILDFANVKECGQGFADEIFRVFQSKQPKLIIEVRNASAAVNFMIKRAMQTKL